MPSPSAYPPMHPLLATRRTTLAFDGGRAISPDEQRALLHAACWAPSWQNRQPWRFVACDRFAHPEAWQRVFDTLARAERPWAYNVPLLVCVGVDFSGMELGQRDRALCDVGGATLQLCLEATARSLATHSTSTFDRARLHAALTLPETATATAIVCIGHPADLGTLGRDVHRREVTPRTREAPATRCFTARWGEPQR